MWGNCSKSTNFNCQWPRRTSRFSVNTSHNISAAFEFDIVDDPLLPKALSLLSYQDTSPSWLFCGLLCWLISYWWQLNTEVPQKRVRSFYVYTHSLHIISKLLFVNIVHTLMTLTFISFSLDLTLNFRLISNCLFDAYMSNGHLRSNTSRTKLLIFFPKLGFPVVIPISLIAFPSF